MKITSRFTVAVHTLLIINTLGKTQKATSDFIASSVNVNPVVIRRTLLSLKSAGFIEVKAGSGGATMLKDPKDITLYDIYVAMDCLEGGLFNFHDSPNLACPVGKNVHKILDSRLLEAQTAMENQLKKTTLCDLTQEINKLI